MLSTIKRVRLELGLRQYQVCEPLGISVSSYSLLENGKRKIRKLEQEKLIEILGKEIECK